VEYSLTRIDALRKQLLDLGYAPFQLRSIIEDTLGTSRLEDVDLEQINLLIETLEKYIQFAIKSKKLRT